MSEHHSVTPLLRALRARVRSNAFKQEVADAALLIGAGTLLLSLWNATLPSAWSVSWFWLVPLVVAAVVRAVTRMRAAYPLWRAARSADEGDGLFDELTSAYWFERHPEEGGLVDLHLGRAGETAAGVNPREIVPNRRPQRLGVVFGCAMGAAALLLLPVPRVFEPMVDRLGELAAELGQDDSGELVAELEETTEREPDPLEDQAREDRLMLPEPDSEDAEGQNALEEQQPEGEGEEPPEDPEGSFMEAEEGDQGEQEGEPQEMQVDNPEDLPESEGEQEPDPNQSQQDGQGESTEESGQTLPAGEEVFLQEGGEEIEQMELGEEEVGHATRDGGEELDLELGELETLEVQLQRELLAAEDPPEDPEEPEEEEKEELVTKAEQSRIEFRDVARPDEAALQDLLQSASVPWEYRQLVLAYFKAQRELDNQKDEEEGERP
ncbi:MAG: hypothetical protein GKS06_08480 [Acidobacteria bacterium]|nr:hypothetical protein [Acidobacteriota bacterium]